MGIFIKDKEPLIRIENHLIDLDGVFSFLTDEFKAHCFNVLVDTVMEIGPPRINGEVMTYEEALAFAKRSHQVHGSCFKAFNLDCDICSEAFNRVYPDRINYNLAGPSQVTVEHLRACSLNMAIFSHSRRRWIWRMLETFRLADVVADMKIPILSRADVGNLLKTNREAWSAALRFLKWDAKVTAVSEDSLKNLEFAKVAEIETTVYISQGGGFDHAKHDYVDVAVHTLPDFLGLIEDVRGVQPRRSAAHSSDHSRVPLSLRDCRPIVR